MSVNHYGKTEFRSHLVEHRAFEKYRANVTRGVSFHGFLGDTGLR